MLAWQDLTIEQWQINKLSVIKSRGRKDILGHKLIFGTTIYIVILAKLLFDGSQCEVKLIDSYCNMVPSVTDLGDITVFSKLHRYKSNKKLKSLPPLHCSVT